LLSGELWTDGGVFEIGIPVILVGIHCRRSSSSIHIRRHLVVVIHFLGVTCGGDEGGEGNPPRPVDHSCTEWRFESVSQSSENVEPDADMHGGCLTR
jgi:hypothetical protein